MSKEKENGRFEKIIKLNNNFLKLLLLFVFLNLFSFASFGLGFNFDEETCTLNISASPVSSKRMIFDRDEVETVIIEKGADPWDVHDLHLNYWKKLKAIEVEKGNRRLYTDDEGVLYAICKWKKGKPCYILECYPRGKEDKKYKIIDGTTEVIPDTFDNPYLEDVTIPDSMRDVRDDSRCFGRRCCFVGCTNLKSITVGANNKKYYVQDGGLIEIEVDDETGEIKHTLICYPRGRENKKCRVDVDKIDAYALADNKHFETLELSARVSDLNEEYSDRCGLVEGCENLKRIEVEEGNEWLSTTNGLLLAKRKDGKPGNILVAYTIGDGEREKVEIPEGTAWILNSAFSGAKKVNTIVVPRSMEAIFEYAFTNSGIKRLIYKGTKKQFDDTCDCKKYTLKGLKIIYLGDDDEEACELED